MKILIKYFANVTEKHVNDMNIFIMQNIAKQDPKNSKTIVDEIIIEISSSGGSSDHGLLAYNSLKQISIPITTIGMGNVDSAAVLIFSAGKKRLSVPSCRYVLHQPMATIKGEFTANKLKELANITSRIRDDYAEVIKTIVKKDNQQKIKRLINQGKVLSAVESLNLGLVTSTIDSPYLSDMKDLSILVINNPITQNPKTSTNKSEI